MPSAPLDGAVPGAPASSVTGSPDRPAIPPLVITGLVVTKADLLAALRLYVPQVTDISPLDGDRFLLGLRPPEP
jgi:hypothetical protein